MKNTTNVFLGGMMLDLAPLSTQQNQLTDALNATFLTYNGNEGILQNDMGNTRIQDANTGNIMGLREGFVPIGMKEHGGVLYIASVNKEGEGEIGTIPSPIIRDFLKDKLRIKYNDGVEISSKSGTGDQFYRISEKLYPGEKFLMSLQIDVNGKNAYLASESVLAFWRDTKDHEIKISYPYITNRSDSAENDWSKNGSLKLWAGVYDLYLYIQNKSGIVQSPDSLLSAQKIKEKGNFEKSSLCWFLNDFDLSKLKDNNIYSNNDRTEFQKLIDEGKVLGYNNQWYNPDLRTMTKGLLKSYPSNQLAGYLCTKAVLYSRFIKEFGILKRQGGMKVPFTVKKYFKDKTFSYYTYFPGFWYTSESAARIKTFKVSVFNETDNSQMLIYYGTDIKEDNIDLYSETEKSSSEAEFVIDPYDKDSEYCNVVSEGEIINKKKNLQCLIENTLDKNIITYIITYNDSLKSISEEVPDTSSGLMDQITGGYNRKKHGGIFYIKFDDYNKNCILNVSFKNLYGENIGTYRLKFNPYLNDTFGTNDMPDFEYAKEISMSYSKKILPCPQFKHPNKNTPYVSTRSDLEGKYNSITEETSILQINTDNENNKIGPITTDKNLGELGVNFQYSTKKYEGLNYFLGYYLPDRDKELGYYNYYYTIYNPPKFTIEQGRKLSNVFFFWLFNTLIGAVSEKNPTNWVQNDKTIKSILWPVYVGFDGKAPNEVSLYAEKILLICDGVQILNKLSGEDFIKVSNITWDSADISFLNYKYPANACRLLTYNSVESSSITAFNKSFTVTLKLPGALKLTSGDIPPYAKATPAFSGSVYDFIHFKIYELLISPQVKIIPYVLHKVILEGTSTPIKAGKLWTKSKFEETTSLSLIGIFEGTEENKLINSWAPKVFKSGSEIELNVKEGTYLILIYGYPKSKRNTIQIEGSNPLEISIAGSFSFIPFVYQGLEESTLKINQGTEKEQDLISSVAYYKVNSKTHNPELITIAEYNYNNKDKEIILPLVSCYRESFYNSSDKKLYTFKMHDTGFSDALYPAPIGSISFTINEPTKDSKEKLNYTCEDWYYQASDTYDKSNSKDLGNSSVRVIPGLDAGDYNNLNLSKEKFKTFWKKQAEPGMSYKSSDVLQFDQNQNQAEWKL